MKPPLRVLIVDDHQMFREGVRNRLEQDPDIQVVGEAGSGKEALESLKQENPSVVILDIRLPDMSGVDVARVLRKKSPKVKILVLTGYDYYQYVREMARIGVDGYLLKDAPLDMLVETLKEIASGGTVLPPDIASKVIRAYAYASKKIQAPPTWALSVRELEVLEFLYQGLKNTEIAERLGISTRTIENHVGSIMSKFGVQTRAQAVYYALEIGLFKK
ncbi:MAG: response regulator transcription factor [Chloroflexota bacterium]|mgnify:CR=1 FL=1